MSLNIHRNEDLFSKCLNEIKEEFQVGFFYSKKYHIFLVLLACRPF